MNLNIPVVGTRLRLLRPLSFETGTLHNHNINYLLNNHNQPHPSRTDCYSLYFPTGTILGVSRIHVVAQRKNSYVKFILYGLPYGELTALKEAAKFSSHIKFLVPIDVVNSSLEVEVM